MKKGNFSTNVQNPSIIAEGIPVEACNWRNPTPIVLTLIVANVPPRAIGLNRVGVVRNATRMIQVVNFALQQSELDVNTVMEPKFWLCAIECLFSIFEYSFLYRYLREIFYTSPND